MTPWDYFNFAFFSKKGSGKRKKDFRVIHFKKSRENSEKNLSNQSNMHIKVLFSLNHQAATDQHINTPRRMRRISSICTLKNSYTKN